MKKTFGEAREKALWGIRHQFDNVMSYVSHEDATVDGYFEKSNRLFYMILDAQAFGLISAEESDEYEESRGILTEEMFDGFVDREIRGNDGADRSEERAV